MIDGLKTDPKSGISKDVLEREKVYGNNRRIIRPPKSYFELLCDAMNDFTMKILLVAACFSIGII